MPVNVTFQFAFNDAEYAFLKRIHESLSDQQMFSKLMTLGATAAVDYYMRKQLGNLDDGGPVATFKPIGLEANLDRVAQSLTRSGA